MFGPEDAFFNRFGSMAASMPVLPLVGADTKFQPVYVDDVAAAATLGVEGKASGVYELGGPEVRSFRELMQEMLEVIQRRRIIVNMPFWIARIMAWVLDMVQAATLGLVKNTMLTRDQVKSLASDNVVSNGAKGLTDLGIQPTATEAILPEYLWAYRPSGQYAAIKKSAKNLRT